jgi:hypothetical protein
MIIKFEQKCDADINLYNGTFKIPIRVWADRFAWNRVAVLFSITEQTSALEVFQVYLTEHVIYAFSLVDRVENSSSAQRQVVVLPESHTSCSSLTFSTSAYRLSLRIGIGNQSSLDASTVNFTV